MFEDAAPSASEVRALAHQLLSWADRLAAVPEPHRPMNEAERHERVLGLAVATRDMRRLRKEIFPGAPIDNPAWNVLLDLFIRAMQGSRTSLDHLSLAGDLPAATVYQGVEVLTGLGMLERSSDRFDSRVIWLSLSATARQGMFDLHEQSAEFVHPARPADADRALA